MKSGRMVSSMVAGGLLGAALGYLARPRNKTMSLMRKGLRRVKW
ncbi:hypothetical protein [Desulfitobacterium sp. Sab5]